MDAERKAKLMAIAETPEPFDGHNHIRILQNGYGIQTTIDILLDSKRLFNIAAQHTPTHGRTRIIQNTE